MFPLFSATFFYCFAVFVYVESIVYHIILLIETLVKIRLPGRQILEPHTPVSPLFPLLATTDLCNRGAFPASAHSSS